MWSIITQIVLRQLASARQAEALAVGDWALKRRDDQRPVVTLRRLSGATET